MKPFPWKCGACRKPSVYPTTLWLYATEMVHDGRKFSITLPDFRVQMCNLCGAVFLDDNACRKLSDALRSAAGLLTPADIYQIRDSLRLTQQEFATRFGVSESTVSRWETGGQIQRSSTDAEIRKLNSHAIHPTNGAIQEDG